MTAESRTCAILYADVVGSSAIQGDVLKAHVAKVIQILANQAAAEDGIIHSNTWGDGIVLVGNTADVIAEEALKIRERFRNENWERKGHSIPVQIRIGLDIGNVLLDIEDGEVCGAAGQGMETAARIEPVVEAGCVWCSPLFKQMVLSAGVVKIQFTSVGMQELAKSAGEGELFDMRRAGETPLETAHDEAGASTAAAPRIPRIKGRVTDSSRKTFLNDAFVEINSVFESGIAELNKTYSEVEASIQIISAYKFCCYAHVNGQSKGQCKIWLGQKNFGGDILYSAGGFDINTDNSYNEALIVEDDGHEIYMKALGTMHYYDHRSVDKNHLSATQAANYLWEGFARQLE